jgi:hypothetical protein
MYKTIELYVLMLSIEVPHIRLLDSFQAYSFIHDFPHKNNYI